MRKIIVTAGVLIAFTGLAVAADLCTATPYPATIQAVEALERFLVWYAGII
jgi:hypothetical protein